MKLENIIKLTESIKDLEDLILELDNEKIIHIRNGSSPIIKNIETQIKLLNKLTF